jgi:RHH-type rel operon transcriptional repressor/antitoxin RelB
VLGVRLDPETERSLNELARQTRRSKSDLAREAISRFVRIRHGALADEARRQSESAAKRGWTEDDAFWESVAAADDFEGAPPAVGR